MSKATVATVTIEKSQFDLMVLGCQAFMDMSEPKKVDEVDMDKLNTLLNPKAPLEDEVNIDDINPPIEEVSEGGESISLGDTVEAAEEYPQIVG